jgi:hypothetical protein
MFDYKIERIVIVTLMTLIYLDQVIETPRIKTIGPMDWSYIIVAELVGPDASNLTGK